MWALSVGLPGREKSISTPFRCAHWSSRRPANSGPLSTFSVLGRPRSHASRVSSATTSKARKLALGTIESASRVWASSTARIRIGRPSNSWSETKSMDQTSFGAAAPGCPTL